MKNHSPVSTNRWKGLFLSHWHPYFWFCLIGLILYSQTLFFNFTYLDDNRLILDNYFFISRPVNFLKLFTEDVFFSPLDAYYRPLMSLSLMINAILGDKSLLIYHLTNILFHLIATSLIFILLKRLKYTESLAFFFSLIFLVHPILAQAVAWIPGRNDSLATIFILASLICFMDYLVSKKINQLLRHFFFFTLALLTKELAFMILPLLILFWLLLARKKLNFNLLMALIFGWGSIIMGWFLLRSLAFKNPVNFTIINMLKSLWFDSRTMIIYLGKIFFPANLSVLPIIRDSNFLSGIIISILLVLFMLISKSKRWSYVIFGISWFLLFLIPSFVRPNPEIVADIMEHRAYAPIIGIFIILLEIIPWGWLKTHKHVFLIAYYLLLIALIVVNWQHTKVFRDRLSFWQNAVAFSPHYPLAHKNLGAMYYLDGKIDSAAWEFQLALNLNPSEPMAHNNLGLIYVKNNQLDKAEAEYRAEIAINPYYEEVYYNLGLLYYQQNKTDEAAKAWEKTISLNPNHLSAYTNLAIHYLKQKNITKARFYGLEVIKRGGQLPLELNQILQLN